MNMKTSKKRRKEKKGSQSANQKSWILLKIKLLMIMKRRRIQMILAFKKGNIRTKKKSTIRKENYQKEEIS